MLCGKFLRKWEMWLKCFVEIVLKRRNLASQSGKTSYNLIELSSRLYFCLEIVPEVKFGI
jgi:hypothetical protein